MTAQYSVFFHLEAAEVIRDLQEAERDRIFRFARLLAANPYLKSDHREYDRRGRPRDVKLVGRWVVAYHVDNAESEVWILSVRQDRS